MPGMQNKNSKKESVPAKSFELLGVYTQGAGLKKKFKELTGS